MSHRSSPPAASTRTSTRLPPPTGSWKPSSNGSTSSGSCWRRGPRSAGLGRSAPRTRRALWSERRAGGRSDDSRRRCAGTHFFNPPRYLRLLELIPTPDTDPAVIAAVARVGDLLLGKGVVVAKDTPNFIGNHIGLY